MTAALAEAARVLVVGGAGFVGSNLVRAVLEGNVGEVVIVDNLLSSNRTEILDRPGVTFIEGSITDDAVLDRVGTAFDYVFNLATYHGNQSSIANPLADHDNNTLTTLKLYDRLAGAESIRKVVYASAGCTVAQKTYEEPRPTTEEDPVSLHLDSPYQISKIVGEMYGNYYHAQHGLPVVHARFQNVYGPWEILGAGRWRGTPATVWRNVTPTFVYRALKGLPLQLDNEGRSTRDFIYVDDIARGLIACAARGEPGEAYNLASGVETTIRELADAINANLERPAPYELGGRRPWDHSGRRLGSTAKAEAQLGFRATIPLADGIRRTVDWTRAHLEMIDRSIERHRLHLPEAIGQAQPA